MSSKRVILLTKDRCLPLKSNQFYGNNAASKGLNNNNNEQFYSINLNKNNKTENIKFEQSKSTLFSKKSRNNNGFFDYKNDSKNALNDWMKNDTPNFNESLKTQEMKKGETKVKKDCNKSTLSLHIEPYKNLTETKNVEFASKSSFNFLKQQNKELMDPESMQFKTSQKLLNFRIMSSAVTRTIQQLSSFAQKQQIVSTRTFYQNPYYARFKKFKVSPDFHKQSTGLTGLMVEERPHHMLKLIYGRLLRALQDIPATSAYRRYTEETIMHRLTLVENESDIQKLEEKIGMGQIEEVIEQAQAELETTRAIIESKAWEPLIEAPAQNQWRWPIA